MSDEDAQRRLHELLTTLPGGPLVAPTGLGRRGRSRHQARAAFLAAGAVLSVFAVVLAVTFAPGTAPRTAPAATPTATAGPALAVPARCGGDGPEPVRHGPLVSPQHTQQQVIDAVRVDRSPRDRVMAVESGEYTWHDAEGVVTGGAWLVELLHVPDPVPGDVQVPVQREQVVVDDREPDLGETLACSLPPAERGATAELPPYPVAQQAGAPAGDLTGHTLDVPWQLRGIDASGELAIYAPHCQALELAVTAVETDQSVVVHVRRSLRGEYVECLSTEPYLLHLRQPLGDRLLLHAAVGPGLSSHGSGACRADDLAVTVEPRDGGGGSFFYRFDLSTTGPACRLDQYGRPLVAVLHDGSTLLLPTTTATHAPTSDWPAEVSPGHTSGVQLDTSTSTCPGVPVSVSELRLPTASGDLVLRLPNFVLCPDRLGFRPPAPS